MGAWVRAVEIDRDGIEDPARFPFDVPAIAALDRLDLHPAVTFLVGENGSGKSTLIEAIAVAAGFNPEGGSRNVVFETRAGSTAPLDAHVRLVRNPRRPRTGYFLRAESFFNVATYLESLGPEIEAAYGGRGLHEQSHGESFLALATQRFGPDGFYVLDEPEAALSPQGELAFLRRMHDLVHEGSQFVIATHSPLLVAYPDATVYELDTTGLRACDPRETTLWQLFEGFLSHPELYLRHVLDDP